MILHWSILKPPDDKTGNKRENVTYHHIFHSFKIFRDDVNIATKKELT